MSGKIDQDIDPVVANLGGELRIVHPRNPTPVIAEGNQTTRDGVGVFHRCIAPAFEAFAVEPGKQWLDEKGDGMLSEICRYIADAQAFSIALPDIRRHRRNLCPLALKAGVCAGGGCGGVVCVWGAGPFVVPVWPNATHALTRRASNNRLVSP